MRKKSIPAKRVDGLRKEYDLSQLKGGVTGKYHGQATGGTNLVLIEPDLLDVFPDGEVVNKAFRIVVEAARSASYSKRRNTR